MSRSARLGATQWLLLLSVLLLALVFLTAAAVRSLNFDESLALRAGWLLVHGQPGGPPFYMPTTMLLGLLGTAIADPGTVFLVARMVASATVLLCLAWVVTPLRSPSARLTALLLTLSNAAFAVHALEFRYDWAILVGWLLAYPLLLRQRRADQFALGLLSVWLAAHHLKGLYFAAALVGMALASSLRRPESRLPGIGRLLGGGAGGGILWLAVSGGSGLIRELTAPYKTFFSLAAEAQDRVWPWQALASTLHRDVVWWAGALLVLLYTGVRLSRRGAREALSDSRTWALLFALVPIGFLFLHPHAWAYMVVPAIPFLALLGGQALADLGPRLRPRLWVLVAALALFAQLAAARSLPWSVYLRSLGDTRLDQVETLRLLRQAARSGDRIVDPSGVAYFMPPCVAEWYIDTLFREPAERGRWMEELLAVDLEECPWTLYTYRMRMLPAALQQRLGGRYVLLEGGGGLALLSTDSRLTESTGWAPLPHRELRSFW